MAKRETASLADARDPLIPKALLRVPIYGALHAVTVLRLCIAALLSLTAISILAAAESDKEGVTQMQRFVVNDKHLLSFGIAITLWEDKASGSVLEMYVTGVQEGGYADQEGVISGTKIYGINGQDIANFRATFSEGSDLHNLFIDRPKGDRVTLEVVKPGHRKSEFVTLVNESGFKVTIRTKAPSSGIALRTEEKSSVYGGLKSWEKKYLDRGAVSTGFTPDMVYIALGEPTDRVTKGFGEYQIELWTYQHIYPDPETIRGFEPGKLTLESVKDDNSASDRAAKTSTPATPAKGSTTLSSHTLQFLFEGGKVSRMAAIPDGS